MDDLLEGLHDTIAELAVKQRWETRVQITLIAPPEASSALLEASSSVASQATAELRVNLVVSRTPRKAADGGSEAEAPREAARRFLAETVAAVPGLVVVREGAQEFVDMKFDDQADGCQVTVRFQATPDVMLKQTHLFRVDAEWLTQMVITCDADVASDFEGAALAAAMGLGAIDSFPGKTATMQALAATQRAAT